MIITLIFFSISASELDFIVPKELIKISYPFKGLIRPTAPIRISLFEDKYSERIVSILELGTISFSIPKGITFWPNRGFMGHQL